MNKIFRPITIAAFLGALLVPFAHGTPGHAADPSTTQEVLCLPTLTLQDWQASDKNEKLAFLFGIASMIELEKEWQGATPLPISKSLNQSWVRGLDGVSLDTMRRAVDKFAEEHPTLSQMAVLEAVGRIYVRPKLSETERQEASAKVEKIKTSQ